MRRAPAMHNKNKWDEIIDISIRNYYHDWDPYKRYYATEEAKQEFNNYLARVHSKDISLTQQINEMTRIIAAVAKGYEVKYAE
jgi:hypothetical protein